jgi:hypothetical protein
MGLANAQGAAAIGQAGQMSNLIGQGMMAYAISDARAKTNVMEISKADLNEMKSHLRAYKFNYKDKVHGEGNWLGVMAQDLEKSKLGRMMVSEDANGLKRIDLRKAVSILLASMAEG